MDNSSTGAVIATYAYDPLDRLVSETASGKTTTYTYVGLTTTIATVIVSDGTTTKATARISDLAGTDLAEAAVTYDTNGKPTYGPATYLIRNGHGDVIANTDNTGTVTGTAAYDTFGSRLATAGSVTSSAA